MALSVYSPPFDTNKSGTVEGSCMQVGLENHIEWYGLTHEITSPRAAGTGLPTGKRQHHPLTATKPLDKASPLLADTLTKNGTIDKIEFKFFRPAASGEETHYFTITLEEATICGIHLEQLNNKYPENMAHETREHVSFTYDKITWEEVEAGTMAFDSWKETVRGG
ncbi:type VI secretion system tube protein TssD [Aurantiacibacter gilvus]|uniref:Type VI secretion system tube protein TssD n=1 Tax=Aurantiacibacter gilvus TaxID=3139141 RepID=A0ABU9II33_9SPHN